ncbi:MAG: hypothetical protein WD231_03895 [Candidatus Woykebacteria bacterium]
MTEELNKQILDSQTANQKIQSPSQPTPNAPVMIPQAYSNQQSSSGIGDTSSVPPGIDGWGWGPFLLTWIWGIFHGVWISLLVFLPIPFLGLIIAIVLGINGRKWAWQNKKWDSAEHFNRTQRNWSIAGFVVIGLFLTVAPIIIILLVTTLVAINPVERLRESEANMVNSEVREVGTAINVCISEQTSKGTALEVIYSKEVINATTGKGGCAEQNDLVESKYISVVPSEVTIKVGTNKICVYEATTNSPIQYASWDSSEGVVRLVPNGITECI